MTQPWGRWPSHIIGQKPQIITSNRKRFRFEKGGLQSGCILWCRLTFCVWSSGKWWPASAMKMPRSKLCEIRIEQAFISARKSCFWEGERECKMKWKTRGNDLQNQGEWKGEALMKRLNIVKSPWKLFWLCLDASHFAVFLTSMLCSLVVDERGYRDDFG